MKSKKTEISNRKKEHLEICSTDQAAFKMKSNGFDFHDFKHYAATEVDLNKIDLTFNFFNQKISYPFLISCMTGGTDEADNINLQFASAASELNIPLGLGSQRYALNDNSYDSHFKEIRREAKAIPILGNIGAAQIVQKENLSGIERLVDVAGLSLMVIHLNPLQELVQKNGEPVFTGLLKAVEKLVRKLSIPIAIKEVGSGISVEVAKKYLDIGIQMIDVAGAGGTSWSGVELIRNKKKNDLFWDWGLPTSYCVRKISKLKKNKKFILVGSGGINQAEDAAKALALGANMVASARIVLMELNKGGAEAVIALVNDWFDTLKKIMFLTNAKNLNNFNYNKLIRKERSHC